MKRALHRSLCLVAVLLVLAGGATRGMAGPKLRISSGEWAPYTSQELPGYGLVSQIVTESFALEGVTVEYGFFPWKRSVTIAENGDWDGCVALARTPQRENVLWYSEDPVLEGDRVFFHLKRVSFDWKELEDLQGLTIGATLAYFYGEKFQQAEAAGKLTVLRTPRDEQNFRMLLAGRIDVFPVTREVGYYILKTRFTPEEAAAVTHHPVPIYRTGFYLVLSRANVGNRQKMQKFNAGLRRLKASGRYDQILGNDD